MELTKSTSGCQPPWAQHTMAVLQTSGARITYLKTGAGPAVLLVQGVGVGGEGWRPQIEALSSRYTLVAFDNRGIGGSMLETGGRLTIDDMARDALAVADAEGLDRFHLVGHSMGGLIAQAIALRARGRVRSLALLCTFLRGSEGSRMSAGLMLVAVRMRLGTKRMRRNAFLELVLSASYLRTHDRDRLARELAPLFGYDLASQPLFVVRQMRAMAAYDAADRWHELADIPTLVVSAACDRIARPEYGRALAAAVGTARYVEIPDAGHAVTIQCADRINQLLDEHFTAVHTR